MRIEFGELICYYVGMADSGAEKLHRDLTSKGAQKYFDAADQAKQQLSPEEQKALDLYDELRMSEQLADVSLGMNPDAAADKARATAAARVPEGRAAAIKVSEIQDDIMEKDK
jgi:hypothetical protein